jgi:hypothetical protein
MTVPDATPHNDREHFDALTGPGISDPQRWGVKYLYDRLGILDNKTSALLRFNGVAMGFLAVLVARIIERPDLFAQPRKLMLLATGTLFCFGFAEIQAFNIFWLRFDRVTQSRTFDQYKTTFFEITCRREGYYRQAFVASALGSLAFFVVILWMILPFLTAIGPHASK